HACLAPSVSRACRLSPRRAVRRPSFPHDALPILESIPGWRASLTNAEMLEVLRTAGAVVCAAGSGLAPADRKLYALRDVTGTVRSEEHTSELQSRETLVCRLLLEKKDDAASVRGQ